MIYFIGFSSSYLTVCICVYGRIFYFKNKVSVLKSAVYIDYFVTAAQTACFNSVVKSI